MLDVDFRIIDTGVMAEGERTAEPDTVDSLVRFREKGWVRVIRVCLDGSERLVYTSGCAV